MDLTYSQAGQDVFVRKILKNKKNGYFLEIGSNDPKIINNTYVLEKELEWKGIMVEIDESFLESYKKHRENSIHVIEDAVKCDYLKVLKENNFPENIDYLQIDLEVNNKSTLEALINLDENVFGKYKFATITFEHDIYRGDYFNTRKLSREIFEKHGYIRVFRDVKLDDCSFEDWYIHPELVDMEYITKIKTEEVLSWQNILKRL